MYEPEFHPIALSRFSPLSNVVTERVITTRRNRMKFRVLYVLAWSPYSVFLKPSRSMQFAC